MFSYPKLVPSFNHLCSFADNHMPDLRKIMIIRLREDCGIKRVSPNFQAAIHQRKSSSPQVTSVRKLCRSAIRPEITGHPRFESDRLTDMILIRT